MKELIDDTFYLKQQRWKTWISYDKDDKSLVTSLTQEQCISATRFYLKLRQEDFPKSKTYDGVVEGKL